MKEKNKVKLKIAKTESCPCFTTPKKTTWNEKLWKKHWTQRKSLWGKHDES